MNIEEAKEEIKKIAYNTGTFFTNYEVNLNKVLQILDKIDQPKIEVPKFVADWYETHKKYLDIELGKLFHRIRTRTEPYDDFYFWFGNNDDALTTIINMHQIGYTIKEEKLYTVEIPDPNSPNVTVTLMRVINGVGICFTTNSEWVEQEEFQLTESEIRKDFEWAWQWAEEVTK
ncbi:DUF1642 domain-containing protein [Streptococcus phocae subsp. phocae]